MCSFLQPQDEGSLEKDAVLLGPFLLDHISYNKNMCGVLCIIGEKVYVIWNGLLKYCRFCPKCVSTGQNRK